MAKTSGPMICGTSRARGRRGSGNRSGKCRNTGQKRGQKRRARRQVVYSRVSAREMPH